MARKRDRVGGQERGRNEDIHRKKKVGGGWYKRKVGMNGCQTVLLGTMGEAYSRATHTTPTQRSAINGISDLDTVT